MATSSSGEGFEQFQSNLEITDLAPRAIAERRVDVKEKVAKDLAVLDVVLTGSCKRGTMIGPLEEADVEFCVILDLARHFPDWTGPAKLLDQFQDIVQRHYHESTRRSRNGHAVTVGFPDFMVDIVPAFVFAGGGYLIPDSHGKRWISTDPERQVEIWTRADLAHRGKLIPLIKMIKAWNKCHGRKLRSFHLESLILKVFATASIWDPRQAVADFFDKASHHVDYVLDPSGHAGNLGYYLDFSSKHAVVDILNAAQERTMAAIHFADFGKPEKAFGAWRAIFGNYFPHYGEPCQRGRRLPDLVEHGETVPRL